MNPRTQIGRHLALLRELRWFIGLMIAARLIASLFTLGLLPDAILVGAVIYAASLYLVLLSFLWFGPRGGER